LITLLSLEAAVVELVIVVIVVQQVVEQVGYDQPLQQLAEVAV
jgi:hypothetical protein